MHSFTNFSPFYFQVEIISVVLTPYFQDSTALTSSHSSSHPSEVAANVEDTKTVPGTNDSRQHNDSPTTSHQKLAQTELSTVKSQTNLLLTRDTQKDSKASAVSSKLF